MRDRIALARRRRAVVLPSTAALVPWLAGSGLHRFLERPAPGVPIATGVVAAELRWGAVRHASIGAFQECDERLQIRSVFAVTLLCHVLA